MPSTVQKLCAKQLIHKSVPTWLPEAIQYETIMGSFAYGVSSDTSDMDMYGFCIPPKDMVFPHLKGEIEGFGRHKQRFEVWQLHGVIDPEAKGGKGEEYDFQIYSIAKYFQLCMENNPNMIDSLFTAPRCIKHITPIGQMVKDSRRMFLHAGIWHKLKGYAYQQLHKLRLKNPEEGSKRDLLIQQYGYDTKFAYHIVRLMDQAEMVLNEGDLDLDRNRERLKAIRRGEWTIEQIEEYFVNREKALQDAYDNTKLQKYPNEDKIRNLLMDCLEQHFGSLSDCVVRQEPAIQAINEIQAIIERYKSQAPAE